MNAIIKGEGNDYFSLSITRYQFAELSSVYDDEWLVMRGEIQSSHGSWQFEDACLQTFEYMFLANWLRNIESPDSPDAIRFIEPNLSFATCIVNGEPSLVVQFELECRPTCDADASVADTTRAFPHRVNDRIYPFRLNDFAAIADSIEAQLKHFPIRRPESYIRQRPRYVKIFDSPSIFIIDDESGTPIFATHDYRSLLDYVSDTLGFSGLSGSDYREVGLEDIKRQGILPPEAIRNLEADGMWNCSNEV